MLLCLVYYQVQEALSFLCFVLGNKMLSLLVLYILGGNKTVSFPQSAWRKGLFLVR